MTTTSQPASLFSIGSLFSADMQMALPTFDVAQMVQEEPGLFLCLKHDAVIAQIRRNYTKKLVHGTLKDEDFANDPCFLFDPAL